MFNRLEKFVKFLHNKKYEISFEENYNVLIIKLKNRNIFFAGWWLGDISGSFIENAYKKLSIKDKIIIEDGVMIGMNTTIMPGVRIGKGSIIGAKSLVVDDIPPWTVAAGNPAKIIKSIEDNK